VIVTLSLSVPVIFIGSSIAPCLEVPVSVESCTVVPSPMDDPIAAIVFYPLAAIPIFIMLRLLFSKPGGSLVTLSLSMPIIGYFARYTLHSDVGLTLMLFLLFPAVWIIPLIGAFAGTRIYRIIRGRAEDYLLFSRRTLLSSLALLLLYGSVYYEYYAYINGS
jgi:hypothetical protein